MLSDIAEVLEMYDKWFGFESWRDFTLDLDDAFDLEGVCMCGCAGVQWRCVCVQCAAGCCRVLQCTALYCIVLQCAAVCCSVLQCVAVCCGVLQCFAMYCKVLLRLHFGS